jgi:hypothetical protein
MPDEINKLEEDALKELKQRVQAAHRGDQDFTRHDAFVLYGKLPKCAFTVAYERTYQRAPRDKHSGYPIRRMADGKVYSFDWRNDCHRGGKAPELA